MKKIFLFLQLVTFIIGQSSCIKINKGGENTSLDNASSGNAYEGACSLIFYDGFESLEGIQESNGTYSGIEIIDGINGKGVMIENTDTLSYSRPGNLDLDKGSIEFWVKPYWPGNDNRNHFFFHYWVNSRAMLSILKGENNKLSFYIYHNKKGHPADMISYDISNWKAKQWRHIAVTWNVATANSDFLKLYVDKKLVAELTGQAFHPLDKSGRFYIGYEEYGWIQKSRANAVIDELRILNYIIGYEKSSQTYNESFNGDPFGAIPAWIISPESIRDFSLAKEAGIKRTKTDVFWGDIEKTKGLYSWDDEPTSEHVGYFDTVIKNAQLKNVKIDHITISARPPDNDPWTVSCKDQSCLPENTREIGCLYDDKNINDFRKFVYNAVERYDGDGVCDMPGLKEGIRNWRVGTEMETRTWCGTGSEFLTVYEDIFQSVKAADPNAKMIFGGLHGCILGCLAAGISDDCDYIFNRDETGEAKISYDLFDNIYSNINTNHVDAFGIHPYSSWDETPVRIDGFKNYLSSKGLINNDLWIIEDGENYPNIEINEESDKRQAEEVIKRFVTSMSRGIEHIYWFNLYYYQNGDYDNVALLEYNCDTFEYMKRPGFYTFKLMTEKLTSYDSVEILSEDSTTYYGYKFMVNNSPVWVLFTKDSNTHNLNLNMGCDAMVTHIVTDRQNTEPATEIITQSNGNVGLTITETPVFVEEFRIQQH